MNISSEQLTHMAFISTDTTGFSGNDELLRVTLMNIDGEVVFNKMVLTEHKTGWQDAEQLHGISPDDIEMHGISIEQIKHELTQALKNYTHVVMYNAEFHTNFLPAECLKNTKPICAMEWSIAYINNHPSYSQLSNYLKLPVLASLLEVNDSEFLRNSINNCKFTRLVWLEMIKNINRLENDMGQKFIDCVISTNDLVA